MFFESQIKVKALWKPTVQLTGSRLTQTLSSGCLSEPAFRINTYREGEKVGLSWGETGLWYSLNKSSVNPLESAEAGMAFESFSSWNEEAGLLYWQNSQSLDSNGCKAALFSQGKSPEKADSWGLCCWPISIPSSLGNTFFRHYKASYLRWSGPTDKRENLYSNTYYSWLFCFHLIYKYTFIHHSFDMRPRPLL